jgi:hypothetical protein
MTQNNMPNQTKPEPNTSAKRPNETGTISVEGFIKIHDPKSKEVFVEKRA